MDGLCELFTLGMQSEDVKLLNRFWNGPIHVDACFDQAAKTICLIDEDHISKEAIKPFLQRDIPVVMLVNSQSSSMAAEKMSMGISDYLIKPLDVQLLASTAERLLNSAHSDVIAHSWQSKQLFQLAFRIARSDTTALVMGESGTGKERIARYIHEHSNRATEPFVTVNCAALPESMFEALLFGHEKGAFTGATERRLGKFEQANNGTIFLDEIGEMPIDLQPKLLRVLQEKEVERLGGSGCKKLNVRVVAATNCDLQQRVRDGLFREDLYYRLSVLPLKSLPLRERKTDILPLAQYFLCKHQGNEESLQLSSSTQQWLGSYSFPGNVRELENIIQRGIVMRRGRTIEISDLLLTEEQQLPSVTSHVNIAKVRKNAEYDHVLEVLRRVQGKRTAAAEELGISTRALRYKITAMKECGIDIDAELASVA